MICYQMAVQDDRMRQECWGQIRQQINYVEYVAIPRRTTNVPSSSHACLRQTDEFINRKWRTVCFLRQTSVCVRELWEWVVATCVRVCVCVWCVPMMNQMRSDKPSPAHKSARCIHLSVCVLLACLFSSYTIHDTLLPSFPHGLVVLSAGCGVTSLLWRFNYVCLSSHAQGQCTDSIILELHQF